MKKLDTLYLFWERLASVKTFTMQAGSMRGRGDVCVTKKGVNTLIFHEKGIWYEGGGFNNALRWTLDKASNVVSLEHLRHGEERPVFLFYLAPCSPYAVSAIDPYVCGKDAYSGKVCFDAHSLRLNWCVIGPRKNEEIETCYRIIS